MWIYSYSTDVMIVFIYLAAFIISVSSTTTEWLTRVLFRKIQVRCDETEARTDFN